MPQGFALFSLLLAALIAACGGPDVASSEALQVIGPRLVLPPPGADNAAGYMQLRNRADVPIVLEDLSSPRYARVELHEMTHGDNGMLRMRRLKALRIGPGESVALEPHGKHLMLMAPEARPQAGEVVPLRIRYRLGEAQRELELALPSEAR